MNKKYILVCSVLLIVFTLDMMLGSVLIPIHALYDILLGREVSNPAWHNIVIHYRMPRAIAGCLVGSSLGLSGLFMQTFFRNPLAGPYVLGVSVGASLGVALVVYGGVLGWLFGIDSLANISMVLSAILGAFVVFAIVMLFSVRVRDNTSLLIIGLMFSSVTSAIVSILQFFSSPEDIQLFMFWTFGDLGSVTNSELNILAPMVLVGIFGSVFLIKPLNIFLLGNQYAQNAGLNLTATKFMIISITALLSGTTTAYCGPIAFIGIATPHIVRMMLDTSDHRILIPFVAIIGAILLMGCDIISRMPGYTYALPLNAITSMFGGPLVIWLILQKRNINQSF